MAAPRRVTFCPPSVNTMEAHVGQSLVCSTDGHEYRCYDVCGRCSHWIANDATMRRRYDDTGAWSDALAPRVQDDRLVASNGQRLERAMFNAWVGGHAGGFATLVDPRRGICGDNVQVVGCRAAAAAPTPDRRRCPACAQRAVAAAIQHGTLQAVAEQLDVKAETALNYVCKGAALLECTDPEISGLIDGRILDALSAVDIRGALRELREAIPDDVWGDVPFPFAQLRLARTMEHNRRRLIYTT